MNRFQTRRIVPFSPGQMFNLVADVETYPEFLPLCEELRVRERQSDGLTEILTADMTIAYKIFRETFSTRVNLMPGQQRITVTYLDGPFRHLENRWKFAAHRRGCEIDFFIAYEFRSRTLEMMMGAMFDAAFRKFAAAFEQRAQTIYGTGDAARSQAGLADR